MNFTRRDLLKCAGAAGAISGMNGCLVSNSWAKTSVSSSGIRVDSLSDGHLRLPAALLFDGLATSQYQPILDKYGMNVEVLEPPCNLTLYRDGANAVLFDVGAGPNFMQTAGKVQEALDALEVAPEEITHVVFTHAHPDHLWGLLDEFDDPVFAEASYHMSLQEWEYWMDPDTVNSIGEARQAFAAGAKRLLGGIEDRVSLFKFGEEILPNISTINTVGHTPGHAAFEMMIGSQSMVVVGDALVNHHLSFERPDLPSGSDQDKETGIETRKRLLDKLSADRSRFVGYHLPDGGIGHAERQSSGYRFVSG